MLLSAVINIIKNIVNRLRVDLHVMGIPGIFSHWGRVCRSYNGEHCGVVVHALDLQSEGRGFESHSVRTPLDKAFCPQLSLSTRLEPGVVYG